MLRLDTLHPLSTRWRASSSSKVVPSRRRNLHSASTLSTTTTKTARALSSTSSSAYLVRDPPSLLLDQLATIHDGGAHDAIDIERILSSSTATTSPSSLLFETADLSTASSVLDFLLHHPLATAAATSLALYLVPRLVRTVTKNIVLPLSVLAVLLVCAAAPGASLAALKSLVDLVSAHPVAVSAVILAGTAVALSPYLLLVAAAAALAWGVPKLPPALRPSLPAPLSEARATLGAAVEAASPALREAANVAKSAAESSTSVLEQAKAELDRVREVISSPAKSAVAAAERAASSVAATADAAKAAASAAAGAVSDVGRCRSEPTAAERAACVRQLEAEISKR
jgi:hypothetical protein